MTKFKIIKLPYDKKEEEKEREKFWNSRHKYFYPNRGVVSLERLAELENRNESKTLSDKSEFVKELNSKISFELLTLDLSPKEKEAVKSRGEGLPRKEIAKFMGIKENAVKQLIYKAYKRIREQRKTEN